MLKLIFLFMVFSYYSICSTDTTIYVTDDTNIILLEFSEPINVSDLGNVNNYIIKDNTGKVWKIKKLGIVTNTVPNNTKVGIVTDRLDYKKTYTIIVSNVRDTAGNYIGTNNKVTFTFDGLNTNLKKTNVYINEKQLKIIRAVAKDSVELIRLPHKVFDGKFYNSDDDEGRWASNPIPEWIYVELESIKYITRTKISFFRFNVGRIYTFTIDYSLDGVNWLPASQVISSSDKEFVEVFINKICKFLRFNILTNNQNTWTSIWEILVYGK